MASKHEKWLKRLGFQEIEITMGMFDYQINVVVGKIDNLEEYIKFKLDDNEFDLSETNRGYGARGKCFYRSGFRPIVWIPRKPRTSREYATLAHESLHAMFYVQRWAGFILGDDTEEVMTHGLGHIINEVLSRIK